MASNGNGSEAKNGGTLGGYHNGNGTKSSGQPINYPNGPMPTKVKPKKEGFMVTYKKLKEASKRPLPSKSGDGQYLTVSKRPGLKDDIKRLKMRGRRWSS